MIVAADAAANQVGSGVPSALEHFEGLAAELNKGCEESGTNGLNPFCSPYSGSRVCNSKCEQVPGKANDGTLFEGTGEDAESSESDQKELCPALNSVQEEAVFVCVPSFVAGDLDTGDKPLIVLGGGALMMVPDDESGATEIKSSKSVIQLGGAIVGDSIEVKAPEIALAGGFLNAIDELELSGEQLSVGRIDGHDVLATIPALPEDWRGEIVSEALLHSDFEVPELVSAKRMTINAEELFLLASASKLLGAGLGDPGAIFETGFDPTGESDNFGGSHGGLGGYATTSLGTQGYDEWYTMEGRSPVSDDPLHPTGFGDGGGGEPTGALGLNGGGAVSIEAPDGEVEIDGKIDVSGLQTGLEDETSNGDHGGAGAGGSVYVTAEKLAGSGTIDADGGGHCDERHSHECFNGGGGGGGGGRIATLFEEDPTWTGTLEAHGGYDAEYTGEVEGERFLGTGGAGTVFTRSVVFKPGGSEVENGTGTYSEGTLTIDGGRPVAAYPPPDGTPLTEAWNGPHRKLVISGEARAYGQRLEFAAIDLLGDSTLTTGIEAEGKAIGKTLSVKAGELNVDSTSRVTMTGRGYAGGSSEGEEGKAEAAPGQSASTDGHGGSHGGVGGKTGAHENVGPISGSTYDSVEDPSEPGGGGAGEELENDGNPGGGVLGVEVQTLHLDGVLAADGEGGDGPTATEPAPFDHKGGAGAGGSLLVRAATISGAGSLTALGGNSCTATTPPLLAGTSGCNAPRGSTGGGGGGRIALYAGAACSWTGTLSAAGGVDAQAELAAEPEDAEAMRGSAGSVYFPTPTGTCPKTEPPAEETHSGAPGPGPGPGSGGSGKPPPTFTFKIVSRKTVVKTGAEILVISVPGAGTVTAAESGRVPVKHRRARTLAVSHAGVSASAAGLVTLTLRLSKVALAYLEKHHVMHVTIKVAFAPRSGKSASLKTEFNLRRSLR